MSYALAQISVGVAVERRRPKSPWSTEDLWRPVSVFVGRPSAQAWTVIDSSAEVTTFYAGEARIELFRTETANYLSNLAMRPPLLWVILRSIPREPGVELQGITADPAEGEALTGSDLESHKRALRATGRARRGAQRGAGWRRGCRPIRRERDARVGGASGGRRSDPLRGPGSIRSAGAAPALALDARPSSVLAKDVASARYPRNAQNRHVGAFAPLPCASPILGQGKRATRQPFSETIFC